MYPKSIYGKTKLLGEKLIRSEFKNSKVNYAILRYFNVAGASDSGKIGQISKGDQLFKNLSIASKKIQKLKYMVKIITQKIRLVLETIYMFLILQKYIF